MKKPENGKLNVEVEMVSLEKFCGDFYLPCMECFLLFVINTDKAQNASLEMKM